MISIHLFTCLLLIGRFRIISVWTILHEHSGFFFFLFSLVVDDGSEVEQKALDESYIHVCMHKHVYDEYLHVYIYIYVFIVNQAKDMISFHKTVNHTRLSRHVSRYKIP